MSSVLKLVNFARPLLAGIALSSLAFGVVVPANASVAIIKGFKVTNGPISRPPCHEIKYEFTETWTTPGLFGSKVIAFGGPGYSRFNDAQTFSTAPGTVDGDEFTPQPYGGEGGVYSMDVAVSGTSDDQDTPPTDSAHAHQEVPPPPPPIYI